MLRKSREAFGLATDSLQVCLRVRCNSVRMSPTHMIWVWLRLGCVYAHTSVVAFLGSACLRGAFVKELRASSCFPTLPMLSNAAHASLCFPTLHILLHAFQRCTCFFMLSIAAHAHGACKRREAREAHSSENMHTHMTCAGYALTPGARCCQDHLVSAMTLQPQQQFLMRGLASGKWLWMHLTSDGAPTHAFIARLCVRVHACRSATLMLRAPWWPTATRALICGWVRSASAAPFPFALFLSGGGQSDTCFQ